MMNAVEISREEKERISIPWRLSDAEREIIELSKRVSTLEKRGHS